jgi:multidrug efflux pump subunit AcrA (membrane-fusion protein)
MANRRPARIIAFGVILAVLGVNGYFLWRPEPAAPIVGVVRTTEIRIAPEVAGQLAAIKVRKGDRVRAGDVLAELSAEELTASVAQARAVGDREAASGRCRPSGLGMYTRRLGRARYTPLRTRLCKSSRLRSRSAS